MGNHPNLGNHPHLGIITSEIITWEIITPEIIKKLDRKQKEMLDGTESCYLQPLQEIVLDRLFEGLQIFGLQMYRAREVPVDSVPM